MEVEETTADENGGRGLRSRIEASSAVRSGNDERKETRVDSRVFSTCSLPRECRR